MMRHGGATRRWQNVLSGIAARNRLVGAVASLVLGCAIALHSEPVAVRLTEGVVHGFLILRTLDGQAIADGDLIQMAKGARVTSRLLFHFRDGSLHDETAVFTQRQQFRLVSYREIQKGPSFPQPLEMSIDAATGQVQVRYTEKDGKTKTETERLELPPDVANGMLLTMLKNLPGAPASFSYVAATPKPRLVKLEVEEAPPDRFSLGGRRPSATHFVLKVDIGGVSGLLAPLVGRQPPDSHVWILRSPAPAFVRAEQAFYTGGPMWRIEMVAPAWPRVDRAADATKPRATR